MVGLLGCKVGLCIRMYSLYKDVVFEAVLSEDIVIKILWFNFYDVVDLSCIPLRFFNFKLPNVVI